MNVGTSSIQNEIDNVLLLHVLIRIGVLLWLLLSATIWFYIACTPAHTHTHRDGGRDIFFASNFIVLLGTKVSWYHVVGFVSAFYYVFFSHSCVFFPSFYSLFIDILFDGFHLFRLRITSIKAKHYQTNRTKQQRKKRKKNTCHRIATQRRNFQTLTLFAVCMIYNFSLCVYVHLWWENGWSEERR